MQTATPACSAFAVVLAWAAVAGSALLLPGRNHTAGGRHQHQGGLEAKNEQCGTAVSVLDPSWETMLAAGVGLRDPFGTTFPRSAAPMCRCNEVTSRTKKLVKFSAFRKFGTKLAIKGGVCFGRYFQRHDNDVVAVVKKCNHGCGSTHAPLPTKEVWWTRHPTDWLISNYLYQRRGDEPLHCYMTFLRKRFDDVSRMRPSQPRPRSNDTKYSDYLGRVNEADGLFMEMYRTTHENDVNTLTQLVAAAVQGSQGGNMKVCLEEFMETKEGYTRVWKDILGFATDNQLKGDKKLDHCLRRLSPVDGNVGHSTFKTVGRSAFARMRRVIDRYDEAWFNSSFAKAARRINCSELSLRVLPNSTESDEPVRPRKYVMVAAID